MNIRTDEQAWVAFPHDRWVYDRLRLSEKLGYTCGPAGVVPPRPADELWMKPIMNLDGMGLGSQPYAYPVPPGSFWMPRFIGQHLSVDYERTLSGWRAVLAVVATYSERAPQLIERWSRWSGHVPPVPKCLNNIGAPMLNVEYIGPHAIEAHLRHNPDWIEVDEEVSALDVVWEGDDTTPFPTWRADFENCDGRLQPARLGFREVR